MWGCLSGLTAQVVPSVRSVQPRPVLSLPPRAGCRPLLEDLQLRMQRSFVYDGTTEGETKGKITPSHREQAIPWKDFVLS